MKLPHYVWVVYGYQLDDIGLSVGRQTGSGYDILYSEGQLYPPELWSASYVREFVSLQEAINYIADKKEITEDAILKEVGEKFPSYV